MTDARLPLAELVQKAGEADVLRSVAEAVLQLLPPPSADGGSFGDGLGRPAGGRGRWTWRA